MEHKEINGRHGSLLTQRASLLLGLRIIATIWSAGPVVNSIFFGRGDDTNTEWLKRLLITTEGEGARLGQSGKQSSESVPKKRNLGHSEPKTDDRSWGVSKGPNPRRQIQYPSGDEKLFGSNSEYTVL